MCGIAGFVDFGNRSNGDILKKMTETLSHRGPDGQGIELLTPEAAQVGLGHRRLSIIDLTNAASQPMVYDGLHIIFNGEIYNYAEIRNTLTAKGHIFQNHSDTEVILHAIREWGLSAVLQWRGMFSIVLYDERTQELIAVRDRAGVKPFNYYWEDDIFIFGSELKAIMAHPLFKKNISKSAVSAFLQFGYVPTPHSIFENTYKLEAGHHLSLNLATKNVSLKQYWSVYDAYNKPKLKISLPDAIEETDRILTESFQYRMVSDVPVGVFLSGGFDSACVTALLQKSSTEKIKTFTIGSEDPRHNEANHAREVAAYLGTDHSEHYCTAKEAIDIIPDLPYYYDEPFADSSAIPTILVSRLARKKVTVALSADAGDETFAGYSRYDSILDLGKKLNKIPMPLRGAMAKTMGLIPSDKIPYFGNKFNFDLRYQKLRSFLTDKTPGEMMRGAVKTFSDAEVQKIAAGENEHLPTKLSSEELLEKFYDPLSFILAMDYQTYLNDDILQKVDRAGMSVSLEGREPLLDQHIVEWAAQLPSEYKYRNGEKKFILKEVVYKYLPKEMMNRPKMGFSIPIDKWLNDELKDMVNDYLGEEKIKEHGLLNFEEVKKLKEDFFKGRAQLHTKIWHLLMFQMWYERWM